MSCSNTPVSSKKRRSAPTRYASPVPTRARWERSADCRPDGRADVVVFGYVETVDVSLVDPVVPGDLVLVHAGVALTALADTTWAARQGTS